MSTPFWKSVMPNLFRHLTKNETLKQVQGDTLRMHRINRLTNADSTLIEKHQIWNKKKNRRLLFSPLWEGLGEAFKLAWRNLWRNKRRTLITVSSIFFGVLLSAYMTSMQEGSYDKMVEIVVEILFRIHSGTPRRILGKQKHKQQFRIRPGTDRQNHGQQGGRFCYSTPRIVRTGFFRGTDQRRYRFWHRPGTGKPTDFYFRKNYERQLPRKKTTKASLLAKDLPTTSNFN